MCLCAGKANARQWAQAVLYCLRNTEVGQCGKESRLLSGQNEQTQQRDMALLVLWCQDR
jgi:hypothetical protein